MNIIMSMNINSSNKKGNKKNRNKIHKLNVEIKMASWCFQLRLGLSVSLPVLDKKQFYP